MSSFPRIPVELVLELIVGTTVLLGVGCAAILTLRSPAKRQRAGELSVAAALLWFGIALLPMPRRGPWEFVDLLIPPPEISRSRWETSDRSMASTFVDPIPFAASNRTPLNTTQPPLPAPGGDLAVSVPNVQFKLVECLVLTYAAGSLVCVIWLAVGRCLLARTERAAVPANGSVAEIYESITKQRVARLLVSRHNVGPASFGLARSRILLPANLCDETSTLHHVLRHEQAHIDRRDAVGHLLLNLALPILYGHPLYWFVRHVITFSRELLADEWATRDFAKTDYVEHMLKILRRPDVRPILPLGTLGFFRLRNSFSRRMEMLMKRQVSLELRPRTAWQVAVAVCAVTFAIALATVLGTRRVVAQNPAPIEVSGIAELDQEVTELDVAGIVATPSAISPPAIDHVEPENDTSKLVQSCEVRALSAQVPALETGKIEEVMVHEGDLVKVGQILAKLADRDARTAVQSRRAEVARMRLLSDGQTELKKALTSLKTAEKRLDAFNRSVSAQSEIELVDARGEVAQAKTVVGSAQTMEDLRKLDLEKLTNELQAAEGRLSQFQVSSPIDGTIVQVYRQAGEWVTAGDPLVRVVDPSRIRILGWCPSDLDPQRSVGKSVSVLNNEGVVVLPGKLVFVNIEKTHGHHQIVIACENRQEDGVWVLVPGQRVNVQILNDSSARPQPVSQSSGATQATNDNSDEIASLEELVQSAEKTYNRARALYELGGAGGDAPTEALGRFHLHDSKAQLAMAKGICQEAVENYELAVKAAQVWVDSLRNLVEHGVQSELAPLINSERVLADAKKNLIRAKKLRELARIEAEVTQIQKNTGKQ